tara:strand:- start:2792 stop:3457 length:666 start_codon:yes stop_codon:yes gene_type:complete
VALGNSRQIISNQSDIHEKLLTVLEKHRRSVFRRHYSEHTLRAFDTVVEWRREHGSARAIILDTGCGVGESTAFLARQNPDALVVGVDQSGARLGSEFASQDNYCLVRADLVDFWRLAIEAAWQLEKHWFLYPNPWPKAKHLQRRWHGHPVFPRLLDLGYCIELRTNWKIYADEFCYALNTLVGKKRWGVELWQPSQFITPFERKYANSGHELWRVISQQN